MMNQKILYQSINLGLLMTLTTAVSHSQIILTDSNFPYYGHVYINPGSGTFGAGNVHIQNTSTAIITHNLGQATGVLSIENNAQLIADEHVQVTNTGTIGDGLLVTDRGKAYFNNGFTAISNNGYYVAAVNIAGSELYTMGTSNVLGPTTTGYGLYFGDNTKGDFNGDVNISAGLRALYTQGNVIFRKKVNIEAQADNASGVYAGSTTTGQTTFNDEVSIKVTPITNSDVTNYGIRTFNNKVVLNKGGIIDLRHSFDNVWNVGVSASIGNVTIQNGNFSIYTPQNAKSYSLYASNGGSIDVLNTVTDINGKMSADGAGSIINVKTNPNSMIYANTEMSNSGIINFDLNQTDWYFDDTSNLNTLIANQSNIHFTPMEAPVLRTPIFKTLNVENLSGNGSTFWLNTTLNDGLSQKTDQIVIGSTSSGQHHLLITNAGGLGDLTQQGIKVVDHLDSVTISTANFQLTNPLVAYIYEYILVQDKTNNDWYLTSSLYVPPVVPPVPPIEPPIEPPVDPNQPPIVVPTPIPPPNVIPIYRTDIGINLVNQQVMVEALTPNIFGMSNNIAGIGSLGEMRFSKLQGTSNKSSSIWGYTTAGKIEGQIASDQIHYDADTYVVNLGADRIFNTGDSLVQVGVMAHLGKVDSKSYNEYTRSKGKGSVDGYGIGGYGTWFMSASNPLSAYVDGFFTYGWYDNEVSTFGNPIAKYTSKIFSATVQGGYPIAITPSIAIEPQLQLTYVKSSAEDYKDHSGTIISAKTKGNVISRFGTYVYKTDGQVKPYAAFNVWYDDTHASVNYTNAKQYKEFFSVKKGLVFDLKAGVKAELNPNFVLWAEANYRRGRKDYKYLSATLGGQYIF